MNKKLLVAKVAATATTFLFALGSNVLSAQAQSWQSYCSSSYINELFRQANLGNSVAEALIPSQCIRRKYETQNPSSEAIDRYIKDSDRRNEIREDYNRRMIDGMKNDNCLASSSGCR